MLPPRERIPLEFSIAAKIFWRLLWRILLVTVCISVLLGFLVPPKLASWDTPLRFVSLAVIIFYSVFLWHGFQLIKPVKSHHQWFSVERRTVWREQWISAVSLWWGFFWRQQVFSTSFTIILGFLPTVVHWHGPMVTLSCLLLGGIFGGIFAMWSLLFHPYGRRTILVVSPANSPG